MRATILYIDDNEDLRELLPALFAFENYHVLTAANGTAGIELFQAEHPDLVLLDYRMPYLDGEAVAHILKGLDPTVPVLMMSGNPIPESAMSVVDGFVLKGESFRSLINLVGRSLQRMERSTTSSSKKSAA